MIPFFWLIREGDLMAGIVIRTDFEPCELRALAKSEKDARVARRLLAIAGALEGLSRADAARVGGMDRQTLRDWVIRFNTDGPEGLQDQWNGGRPARLNEVEQAELAEIILNGPDPEADGISAYTLEDLAAISKERWAKPFHPASMSRVVRRLGFSRQKARPSHPKSDENAAEAFKKGA